MTTTTINRIAPTSRAPLTARCFVRLEIDLHDANEIARDFGITFDEVYRLAGIERVRRIKAGQWKPRTERAHVVLATENRVCDEHGPFVSEQLAIDPPVQPIAGKPLPTFCGPFWSRCPACNGAMQLDADQRAREIATGQTEREHLNALAVRAAGIPSRFAGATLDNWQAPMDAQRAVRNALLDYCANFALALDTGRSLALIGPPGTGKTHAGIGILHRVLRAGGTGYYTTAADAVARIRATYGAGADESEADAIKAMVSVDLLIVDECGRSLDTAHENVQLFRILDARYREMRPVVLISNLSRTEFAHQMGDALIDRLREGGGAVLVLDWASHRNRRASA